MNTPTRHFALTASALAIAALLSACGGGDASGPPDTQPPTLTITDNVTAASTSAAVTFTFSFNESVGSSFTADDVVVTGGSKGAFTMAADGKSATLVVTPTVNASGTMKVDVAAGSFADVAGNKNTTAYTGSQDFSTIAKTQMALPVSFDSATVDYGFVGFGGADAVLAADPTSASNMVAKVTRGANSETYAGVTISNAAGAGFAPKLPLNANDTRVSVRVYSPDAGIPVRLKAEDSTNAGITVETNAITTKAGAWETLTFDFKKQATGTAALDVTKTFNKVTIFFDFDRPKAASVLKTYYFDDITFVPGVAAPAAGNTTIDFAATAMKLGAFGSLGAEIANDPTLASNKVGKLTKVAASETWAGATLDLPGTGANTVTAFDFATSKLVTLKVYSPAAGELILLKVENSADGGVFMEARATTTKANAWETLTFNYGAPSAGVYNAAKVYDRVSVFPHFDSKVGADSIYYIDDLNYAGVAAAGGGGGGGGAGGLVALTNGVYASNYKDTPTPWVSVEGGTAGRYIDDTAGAADWWSGLAAADATPSFYFGYGVKSATKPWGFGAYVKAPGNGAANVAGYSNLRLAVWSNDELANIRPTYTVILKGPVAAGCTPELQGSAKVAANGAQTYTLPLAGFTLKTACSFASAAAALAAGVAEIHIQVLGANVQYVKSPADAPGFYANGLNLGPISFN